MSDSTLIFGKNSICEALLSNSRNFNRILISDNAGHDEKIEQIKTLAKQQNIVYQFVKKEKLNQLSGDTHHQGVVALVSPVRYTELEDFIERNSGKHAPLVLLDGIEDSHNLGAIIRTAVCAGVKGVIIPTRRGVMVNSTVEKTSAGAVNHIEIIKVNSLVNAVQKLKEHNWWVIAADHHAEDNYYDVDFSDINYALVMGAEHEGISKSVLKLSDFRVKIPMLTNFNSLNVSNATAIILFESVRQKTSNKKQRGL